MQKTNQDIRDYMFDHSVSQRTLAKHMGLSASALCIKLKKELTETEKESIVHLIDTIASDALTDQSMDTPDIEEDEPQQTEDVSTSTKFQIGDRVKIPSKQMTIGTVSDIWFSLLQNRVMYAVDIDGGSRGLYSENQLEPAPLPIEYTFSTVCENNVAVIAMTAHQGDKTWVYARGHAHILHDGEVGLAQAVSYAARRMFESLDRKQENQIYFKGDGDKK